MKFDICKTLILAVVFMGAGCGNLTEPNSFSFATLSGVPLSTSVQSNVVTIEGNQFGAAIAFADMSSAAYSQISIDGGAFTGASGQLLAPGTTLQLQQTTSSNPNSPRTTAITVGGFTATFTTVTSITGGIVTASDTSGNTVTIKSISAALSAPAPNTANGVNYTITADAAFSTTNTTGTAGSNIPVAFTLQAISNTGQVIYQTTATQVQVPLGEQTLALFSGTLPATVTGNLPNAVNGNSILTTYYWSSLISYWQILPGSLSLP